MKSILIPTVLQHDMLHAVRVALTDAKPTAITLLYFIESDDTPSATYWLRTSQTTVSRDQELLLDECRQMVAKAGCSLNIRQQYAVTGPLLRNLLDYLDIGLVIIPESFQHSTKTIHRQCVKVLHNVRLPILQLAAPCETNGFAKALYLQKNESVNRLDELLNSVDAFFNLDIVCQTSVDFREKDDWAISLFDTINRKEIDLVVETRSPQKLKLSRVKSSAKEKLELPVLSLYEAVR